MLLGKLIYRRLFHGTVTVTGAIIVIIGWFTLVEYDHFSESERKKIVQSIKRSPIYISLIALMPVGIIINLVGTILGFAWMVIIGATLIFLQGIIVSLLFWKIKRWKGIFLFSVVVALGIFIYVPLFIG